MTTREPLVYRVEQGMANPRKPEDIGWRYWNEYPDRPTAVKEAKRIGLARVIECQVVYKVGY